ncbi:MAG: hypothetical protein EKK42_20125 [Pseudonocardiaceae bacterium]|nr:MAG: hypothetical protein EKK42_20125 [Pseudonocardiaceae bacterium]
MTEENNDAELSLVLYVIAIELDYPSVYMGGPSPGSKRRARDIVTALRANGVTFNIAPDDE